MTGPVAAGRGRRERPRSTSPWTCFGEHRFSRRRLWARRAEIARIVTRHGLGLFIGNTGIGRFVPFHHGWFHHEVRREPYERHEHLRMLFEDLGATYIKIGQILSARPDLLDERYRSELAQLQDTAPLQESWRARDEVERQLARPLRDVFSDFGETPIAAASIGQAYCARLTGGTEVIVKVRRPGVVEHVTIDLCVLARLAHHLDRWWPPARRIGLAVLIDEFGSMLRCELDYTVEAANAARLERNLTDMPWVVVPTVHDTASTANVLTLDFVRGARVDDLDALRAAGVSPQDVAARVTDLFLKMVFNDGFFHADPHPGNLLVDERGCIGLIDFGMVGELTPPLRETLAGLLTAMVSDDIDGVVDHFIQLGIAAGSADRDALRRDLDSLMRHYVDQPVGSLRFGTLLQDHLAVARAHRLHLPPELALLTKTLVMCEGLAARLDPDFQMLAAFGKWLPKLTAPPDDPTPIAAS
jgi:ubiquinone biosynthesis protein